MEGTAAAAPPIVGDALPSPKDEDAAPFDDGCARRGDRHVPCVVVATSRQAGTENVERGIRAGAIGTIIAALHPQETAASTMSKTIDLAAEPYAFTLSPEHCALLIIDMQRDFLEPGGFGEMLGNDVSQLRRTIEPNRRLLAAWRAAGLPALHTREGHRPDLSDLPPAKKIRGRSATTIGDAGPMGRILVRGEAGHDIIPELYPAPGEPVIDKPGKGAFHATDLHAILQHRGRQAARRHRRHDRGLRQHHGARGQRPRLRLPRARRLRRVLLSRFPRHGVEDDQGSGRHLRLGHPFGRPDQGFGRAQVAGPIEKPPNDGERAMSTTTMATGRERYWVPGDWNAFFGFGTNILVNVLVLTGLLRFVLKMPDSLVFGRILPATRADAVPQHGVLRLARLSVGPEDRPHGCLRPAVGHQRAAHVRRHLRGHAADPAQDQRSDPGLGGGPHLGVRPELRPDGRRLHRAR